MNDENYNPFSTNGMLDLATILGFLDTENGNRADEKRTETLNTSSLPSSTVPLNWLPRQATVSVSDFISSPLDVLDTIRTEQNDFQTNGIVMELDEFDLYQAKLREVPLTSQVTKPELTEPTIVDAKRKKKAKCMKNTVCVFCKNNGETLSVYGTHLLKDSSGRVTCPILRRYTCPICGAVGDSAHTLKYCPLNTNPVSCLSILRSPRASNGKSRQLIM